MDSEAMALAERIHNYLSHDGARVPIDAPQWRQDAAKIRYIDRVGLKFEIAVSRYA